LIYFREVLAMVMTVLEARVKTEAWEVLKKAYSAQAGELPLDIVGTYLVQNANAPSVWRIITAWRSREALDKMRSQGTPAGVVMFRSAGAEPTLSLFNVVAEMAHA
jgi:hypothetical protein